MPDAAVKGTVNPVGIDGAGPLLDTVAAAAGACALLALLLAAVSLVLRFRRSRGVERLQIKWFAFAAALFAARLRARVLRLRPERRRLRAGDRRLVRRHPAGGRPRDPALPALRHRRRDQPRARLRRADREPRRDVPGAACCWSGWRSGHSGFAVAVSTLAVAALFRPLRARASRPRSTGASTAAATTRRGRWRRSASRLRDELDLETLGADLRGVVRETVQPAHVSLWLRSGS